MPDTLIELVNIKDEDIDTAIYRYCSLQRAKQLFEERTLTLVNPTLWDDPFENFVLNWNIFVTSADGKQKVQVNGAPVRDRVFGQSWTFVPESDAMWRIYSVNKKAVKIRTTLKKLKENIANHSSFRGRFYLGAVGYGPKDALSAAATQQTIQKGNLNYSIVIIPLLLKRMEFAHEAEVRLIYIDDLKEEPDKVRSKILQVPIDPADCIEDIQLDPRISDEYLDKCAQEFRSVGYSKSVTRSNLYDAPELEFFVQPLMNL